MRERETAWVGEGAERKGDTESEAGSRLWGFGTEPDAGLELTQLRDHDLSRSWTLRWRSHPGAPMVTIFIPGKVRWEVWDACYQDSVRHQREVRWALSPRALSVVLTDYISKHGARLPHLPSFGTWVTHNETTETQEGPMGILGEIDLFLFFRN